MRAQEFVKEAKQATAQQVLSYINSTHHEPFQPGEDMYAAVVAHPQWELVRVPLLNLNIPDPEYDDVDYDDHETDPYGRVMTVEPEHAGEVSRHLVDTKPIVIDADRYIIDGNHRAWAAKYLLKRDYIMAWRPVKTNGLLKEYKLSVSRDADGVAVKATAGGKNLGHAEFFFDEEGRLDPQTVWVDERFHGQGIARDMYDHLKSLGYTIIRSWDQTDAGKGFWDKHRGPDARVWENFADGKVKGKSRPGRVKRAGASCAGSVTDLRARAKKYGGERGRMYHWCANMKSGRKKNK